MNRVGAFLFLARCLARDDRAPVDRVDWPRVVEIASEHWMTLALYQALAEKRLVDTLPSGLVEYFEYLHEANRSRNRGILEHVAEIAVLLNEIGVEPLLLKGACNLASGLYPDPAVRFLYDVDILVPEDRSLECWHHLVLSGYRTMPGEDRPEDLPDCEWPALVREGRTAELEMHRIGEWRHMLGSPELYSKTLPLALPRGRARMLEPTTRLTFTMAHAFVHHRLPFRATAHLRDLYDATLLLQEYGAEIDWQRVIQAFESAGEMTALRHGFLMWRRFFRQNPPYSVNSSVLASLYWPRCLLHVAKPQLAWICSRLEMNLHVRDLRRSLIRPSVIRRKLRFAARIWTRPPAADPIKEK
jgi:hypothetical protein